MKQFTFITLICKFLIATSMSFGDTVTFFDGDFGDSEWTVIQVVASSTNNSFVSSQVAMSTHNPTIVGNPGFFREITLTFGPGVNAVAHMRDDGATPFQYDPSTQGPIDSLDYSYDLIFTLIANARFSPLLRQDNNYFVLEGFPDVNTSPSWTEFGSTGLVESDFVELITGTGSNAGFTINTSNPDFSIAGSNIEIGFLIRDSTQSGPQTQASGIDNLEIQLHSSIGDVNCDGQKNLQDVAPFVEVLANGEYQPKADINQDGSVNKLDIPLFVGLLSGG